jgi:hypothetical protein
MSTEISPSENNERKVNVKVQNNSPDTVYAIGLIGAWIYYISKATTPQEKLKGFLKGFAWPAILVKEMLTFFHQE